MEGVQTPWPYQDFQRTIHSTVPPDTIARCRIVLPSELASSQRLPVAANVTIPAPARPVTMATPLSVRPTTAIAGSLSPAAALHPSTTPTTTPHPSQPPTLP